MRLDVYVHLDELDRVPPWAVEQKRMLGQIIATLLKEERIMSQMDDELKQATDDAKATRGAVDSAVLIINGIQQKIADAVAAALAAGATPEQLQSVTDLDNAIKSQKSDIEAAIANSQTI